MQDGVIAWYNLSDRDSLFERVAIQIILSCISVLFAFRFIARLIMSFFDRNSPTHFHLRSPQKNHSLPSYGPCRLRQSTHSNCTIHVQISNPFRPLSLCNRYIYIIFIYIYISFNQINTFIIIFIYLYIIYPLNYHYSQTILVGPLFN